MITFWLKATVVVTAHMKLTMNTNVKAAASTRCFFMYAAAFFMTEPFFLSSRVMAIIMARKQHTSIPSPR